MIQTKRLHEGTAFRSVAREGEAHQTQQKMASCCIRVAKGQRKRIQLLGRSCSQRVTDLMPKEKEIKHQSTFFSNRPVLSPYLLLVATNWKATDEEAPKIQFTEVSQPFRAHSKADTRVENQSDRRQEIRDQLVCTEK